MPKRKPKVEEPSFCPSKRINNEKESEPTSITSSLRKRSSDKTSNAAKDLKLRDELRKSRVWSLAEKQKFLKALKKYGFGGLEHVAKEVGTRSLSETLHFCESRKKQLAKNRDTSVQKASNLNKWKEKIADSLDVRLKAPPYIKQSLAEVMDSAKVECKKLGLPTRSSEEEANLRNDLPDFASIYDYFKALFLQETPPPVGPSESFLTLHLMNDLLEILKTSKLDQEKNFLSCMSKRPRIAPKPEDSLSLNPDVQIETRDFATTSENGGICNEKDCVNKNCEGKASKNETCKEKPDENQTCKEKPDENQTCDEKDNETRREEDNLDEIVPNEMECDENTNDASETINQRDDDTNDPSTSVNDANDTRKSTTLKKSEILIQLAAKYPKLNLMEHYHRLLIAELNPLQIPIDLIKDETLIVIEHLTKSENMQK